MNEARDIYLLGKLSTNKYRYMNIVEEQKPVSKIIGTDSIAFFVDILSDEPLDYQDLTDELYVAVDSQHFQMEELPFYNEANLSKSMYMSFNPQRKKTIIFDNLKEKLLLLKINPQENDFNISKNVVLLSVLENEISSYKAIPKIDENTETFEENLYRNGILMLGDYTDKFDFPESVICGDYMYLGFEKDNFQERSNKFIKAWEIVGEIGNIKKVKLESMIDNIISIKDIVFIKNNDYNYLKYNTKKQNIKIEHKDSTKKKDKEVEFLEYLEALTIDKNLYYDMKDIVNLHVSVKTNYITIIAGMSGTGKTKLSLSYAESLKLSEEEGTLLFLPITPSYTEPEDITGYLNTTTGLYTPAESGLVDLLIHAQNFSDKLHFVIFDEMNLSQVEYWFAPFISLLELEKDKRILKLYNKNSVCHNSMKYPATISLGDNIRFIGTVNLDETTKDFSDRLLDRANLVTLNKGSLKEIRERFKYVEISRLKSYIGIPNEYMVNNIDVNLSDFEGWIKTDTQINTLSDLESDLLDEIHDAISLCDFKKGVSLRVAYKIANYISNIPSQYLDKSTAFDLQIKQRVLSKLRGSERQIGDLIGKIDADGNLVESKLNDILSSENAQKISDFSFSKAEIKNKAKELTYYGYTS